MVFIISCRSWWATHLILSMSQWILSSSDHRTFFIHPQSLCCSWEWASPLEMMLKECMTGSSFSSINIHALFIYKVYVDSLIHLRRYYLLARTNLLPPTPPFLMEDAASELWALYFSSRSGGMAAESTKNPRYPPSSWPGYICAIIIRLGGLSLDPSSHWLCNLYLDDW